MFSLSLLLSFCFFLLSFCQFAGIYFHIIGYGKCSWTDLLRRESVAIDGKGERSAIKYSGTEEYLNSTMYIVGSKNGNCTLANGKSSDFLTIIFWAIYLYLFNCWSALTRFISTLLIELNSCIGFYFLIFIFILLILIEPSV